jgi:hypothetical protein
MAHVVCDVNNHTSIEVERKPYKGPGLSAPTMHVFHIPMVAGQFTVVKTPSGEFDKYYSPLEGYPVHKAAALYAGYAADTGGTPEAMEILSQLTPLTKGVIEMATKKQKPAATDEAVQAAEKPAKATKAKAEKPAKEAKAPKAKAEKPAKAKAEKPAKAKAESSAGMFRRLIVENQTRSKPWSDDEIFDKVQKVHDVAEDKRKSYVGFYRYDCKRKGLI